MGKKRDSGRKRMKRLLIFLLVLFFMGCAGLVILRMFPDILNVDEMKETVRDTVMQVPDEVQDLRDKEVIEEASESYEYYYQQLDDKEKKIYRELLDGILERSQEIYISSSENEKISRAFQAVGMDHSELFWMHNHKEAFQTIYPISDYCVLTIEYLYTDEEIAEIQAAMENAWTEVTQRLSENTAEYDKVQTVYTYLIDEIEYVESEHDQNLAGAFWKRECVCAGYTRAAQYLLNRMGIPCIFVSGITREDGTSHSWNVVEIDGMYYYMDATNGDQTRFLEGDATELAEHKTILCDYLCPFPSEYERMFEADKDFTLPVCTDTSRNFYVANQGIFEQYDFQQLYDYCCMRLNNGAAVVRFKFTNAEEFQKAAAEWAEGEAIQEVAQYYLKMYNLQSIEYHIGVLDQFYTIYIMF